MPAHTATEQVSPDTTLEVRRVIRASRERCFQAWTSPDEVKQWSACVPLHVASTTIDLRVGGAYTLSMHEPDGTPHDAFGVYREIDPPSRLVYTWSWVQEPDVKDTIVTVEFNDVGDGRTEVVLRHEGLPSVAQRNGHAEGWTSILEKLEHFAG